MLVAAPRVQNLFGDAVPVRRQAGVEIRVFSEQSGNAAAVKLNHVPVTMIEGRLEAGVYFTQNLRADEVAFVVIFYALSKLIRKMSLSQQMSWLGRRALKRRHFQKYQW